MKLYFICLLFVLASCAHLPTGTGRLVPLDVPTSIKLGYVSGMTAQIEVDHTFKILIYGETEAHGGIRLTPLVFGQVDPNGETKISDQTVVTLKQVPNVALRCYRGVILCDSVDRKIQIKLEVKEAGAWHPFGWNGMWPLIVAATDHNE